MTKPERKLAPHRDIKIAALGGAATFAVLVATVGIWSATAPLSGAVIAPGQVVVESNVRRIQHPTGGVVSEIRVNDGDRVTAGDVLLRLDETNARASLALIDIELQQFIARKARLEAERDEAEMFPAEGFVIPDDATARRAFGEEVALFRSRQAASSSQTAQLRERIAQAHEEITGLDAQLVSKREQKRLIELELSGVQQLFDQQLIGLTRLTSLQREAASLGGEEGNLIAETARVRARIVETELQILQIGRDIQREVSSELRDTSAKIADLSERRIAAVDQLNRTELRAPQGGIVHQKAVHTIGGVVGPGEQIMLIIPEKEGLVVEARVEPAMIDRLRTGQDVLLRFSAFDAATTPDLAGHLSRVSADLSTDPATGATYYTARVGLEGAELDKLGGKKLLPGMPVETFIQTGSRTALAYLVKPFEDQIARSFRY